MHCKKNGKKRTKKLGEGEGREGRGASHALGCCHEPDGASDVM